MPIRDRIMTVSYSDVEDLSESEISDTIENACDTKPCISDALLMAIIMVSENNQENC